MLFGIAIGYWFGAAVLWLPLALMVRQHNSAQEGMKSVLAGLVLSTIWPVSLPIVGGLYAARHVRRRPVDVPETALVSV